MQNCILNSNDYRILFGIFCLDKFIYYRKWVDFDFVIMHASYFPNCFFLFYLFLLFFYGRDIALFHVFWFCSGFSKINITQGRPLIFFWGTWSKSAFAFLFALRLKHLALSLHFIRWYHVYFQWYRFIDWFHPPQFFLYSHIIGRLNLSTINISSCE